MILIRPENIKSHFCKRGRKQYLLYIIYDHIGYTYTTYSKGNSGEVQNHVRRMSSSFSILSYLIRSYCIRSCNKLWAQTFQVEGFLMSEMSDDQLLRKIGLCEDLLTVINILDPGLSRLRGKDYYQHFTKVYPVYLRTEATRDQCCCQKLYPFSLLRNVQ